MIGKSAILGNEALLAVAAHADGDRIKCVGVIARILGKPCLRVGPKGDPMFFSSHNELHFFLLRFKAHFKKFVQNSSEILLISKISRTESY